jgi:hypothetical protein
MLNYSTIKENFEFALGEQVKVGLTENNDSVEFCFDFKGFSFCQKHSKSLGETELTHQIYSAYIHNFTSVVNELIAVLLEEAELDFTEDSRYP